MATRAQESPTHSFWTEGRHHIKSVLKPLIIFLEHITFVFFSATTSVIINFINLLFPRVKSHQKFLRPVPMVYFHIVKKKSLCPLSIDPYHHFSCGATDHYFFSWELCKVVELYFCVLWKFKKCISLITSIISRVARFVLCEGQESWVDWRSSRY